MSARPTNATSFGAASSSDRSATSERRKRQGSQRRDSLPFDGTDHSRGTARVLKRDARDDRRKVPLKDSQAESQLLSSLVEAQRLGPAIKAVFDRGWEDKFQDLLAEQVSRKDSEVPHCWLPATFLAHLCVACRSKPFATITMRLVTTMLRMLRLLVLRHLLGIHCFD